MKVPLLLREIETRTEDSQEKRIVLKILDKEEASISTCVSFFFFAQAKCTSDKNNDALISLLKTF